MSQVAGITLNGEFFKTTAVVLGLALSLYSGISFVSGYFAKVESLTNQVGRLEVHIAKIDDQLKVFTESNWAYRENLADAKEMALTIKQLERTVFELTVRGNTSANTGGK